MQKSSIELPAIKLVGIQVRTSNQAEADWQNGKIFPCVQKYFHKNLAEKIPNRKTPGTTYCVYTDYESDYTGPYTYFIGEAVNDFNQIPEGHELSTHIIPVQNYTKFTAGPGSMPGVLGNAWQQIWQMSDKDLEGKRLYKSDFEVYDERAADHQNIVLDIYIGVGK